MELLKIYLTRGMEDLLSENPHLDEYGIQVVASPRQADWIISHRVRTLLRYIARFPWKRFMVCANEPRLSETSQKQQTILPWMPKIEIVNVYTGDLLWHNLHFLGAYHYNTAIDFDLDVRRPLRPITRKDLAPVSGDQRSVAALFTYRINHDTSCIIDGVERDLEQKRCNYALSLHEAGLCDIYGSNWPDGISREESGFGTAVETTTPWWTRKMNLLPNYRYNLCLENTSADYYCTEKIWMAIAGGTLPLYEGAPGTVYQNFPKDSFVDLADFEGPEELLDYLQTLPVDEYLERVNCCREAYNHSIEGRAEGIAKDYRVLLDKLTARMRK